MKKFVLALSIFWLLQQVTFGIDNNFKLIRTIDGEDDYVYSEISGAFLSQCREIFILDFKDNTISKYDWEGRLIKRVGRKGQGPMDFLGPKCLCASNDKLFLLDQMNTRIAEFDLNLENFHYIKLSSSVGYPDAFHVLDNNRFLVQTLFTISNSVNDNEHNFKIAIIDNDSKVQKSFFDLLPIKPDNRGRGDKKMEIGLGFLTSIKFGFNDKGDEMLIAFGMPDNPIVFYIFDTQGKMLKTFKHSVDKSYTFPFALISGEKLTFESLKGVRNIHTKSVCYYQKCWYVFMELRSYRTYKDYDSRFFYLKYDENGQFLGEFPTEKGFQCFFVSTDGYFLGKHSNADYEQLMVYKILNN